MAATTLICLAALTIISGCGPTLEREGAQRAVVAAACEPLDGAELILDQTDKRFVIFGEMHGTAEAPALFGDFVCLAAERGPIVVGLEIHQFNQPAVDAYLVSDGAAEARATFMAADHWTVGQDGRNSEAMFALVDRLRRMKARGARLAIVAFQPNMPPSASQTPSEKAMAALWITSLRDRPDARFVGLVGNLHNLTQPMFGFEPAGMHMPRRRLLTLGPAPTGGMARWCDEKGCGARPLQAIGAIAPKGISQAPPVPRDWPQYDYLFSPGAPFTASPPIVKGAAR